MSDEPQEQGGYAQLAAELKADREANREEREANRQFQQAVVQQLQRPITQQQPQDDMYVSDEDRFRAQSVIDRGNLVIDSATALLSTANLPPEVNKELGKALGSFQPAQAAGFTGRALFDLLKTHAYGIVAQKEPAIPAASGATTTSGGPNEGMRTWIMSNSPELDTKEKIDDAMNDHEVQADYQRIMRGS